MDLCTTDHLTFSSTVARQASRQSGRRLKMQDENFNATINLLPRNDSQRLRSAVESLKQLDGRQREHLCRNIRDGLLKEHANVETLFAVYRAVFRTYLLKRPPACDPEWKRFNRISCEGEKRLQALRTVGKLWGMELVHHYGFLSKGRKYCDILCSVAKRVESWAEAVRVLNWCIYQRELATDGRIPSVRDEVNPIELWDLQQAKAAQLLDVAAGALEGFGYDHYGLLVREKWSVKPDSSSIEPAATTGSEGYTSGSPPSVDTTPQPSTSPISAASQASHSGEKSQTSQVREEELSAQPLLRSSGVANRTTDSASTSSQLPIIESGNNQWSPFPSVDPPSPTEDESDSSSHQTLLDHSTRIVPAEASAANSWPSCSRTQDRPTENSATAAERPLEEVATTTSQGHEQCALPIEHHSADDEDAAHVLSWLHRAALSGQNPFDLGRPGELAPDTRDRSDQPPGQGPPASSLVSKRAACGQLQSTERPRKSLRTAGEDGQLLSSHHVREVESGPEAGSQAHTAAEAVSSEAEHTTDAVAPLPCPQDAIPPTDLNPLSPSTTAVYQPIADPTPPATPLSRGSPSIDNLQADWVMTAPDAHSDGLAERYAGEMYDILARYQHTPLGAMSQVQGFMAWLHKFSSRAIMQPPLQVATPRSTPLPRQIPNLSQTSNSSPSSVGDQLQLTEPHLGYARQSFGVDVGAVSSDDRAPGKLGDRPHLTGQEKHIVEDILSQPSLSRHGMWYQDWTTPAIVTMLFRSGVVRPELPISKTGPAFPGNLDGCEPFVTQPEIVLNNLDAFSKLYCWHTPQGQTMVLEVVDESPFAGLI